jgi:hypothetical protein
MATELQDAQTELAFWTELRSSYVNGVTEYTVNGKTVKRVSFDLVIKNYDYWKTQVSVLSGTGGGCILAARHRGDYR